MSEQQNPDGGPVIDDEPDATFYDGVSNRRRTVELRLGPTLDILEGGKLLASWPWEWVRRADSSRAALRLRTANGTELARLDIWDEALAARVATRCPRLEANDAGQSHSTWRIVGWSAAAAVSIVLVATVGVPYLADRIAPLLPQSFENRLGDMVDGQVKTIFGRRECTSPEGQKAFEKMVGLLEAAGEMRAPLRAAVLDSNIRNAIALPGGKVYLFRGLLTAANNPDEVAGVLGHELGHVHHRDGMRRLLQTGGTSFLLGLLFGDVTGAGAIIIASRQLLDASYSRDAENRADGFAITVMRRLERPPQPMGELLLRITGRQGGKAMDIFASHPFSEDRLARMKKEAPQRIGPPLLTAAEWKALKEICGPDKPEATKPKTDVKPATPSAGADTKTESTR
jgi:Zn-dependent protease with chaperone function